MTQYVTWKLLYRLACFLDFSTIVPFDGFYLARYISDQIPSANLYLEHDTGLVCAIPHTDQALHACIQTCFFSDFPNYCIYKSLFRFDPTAGQSPKVTAIGLFDQKNRILADGKPKCYGLVQDYAFRVYTF